MKDQRKTEIKVGVTVAFGLLVFIWILTWAKNFQIASAEVELKILFQSVSGLQIGNDVTVNGIKRGYVKDYYPSQNKVLVITALDKSVDLKSDAVIKIEITDLMGGKKIEIYPGQSSEQLDLSVTQNGVFNADLAGLMSTFGSVETDFRIIIEDLKKTINIVNQQLLDEQSINDLNSTLKNMNAVSAKLNSMLTQNQNDIREIISNTKDISSDTKAFLSENKQSLTSAVNDLSTLLKKSDSLFTKLNNLTDETMQGKNNIGKLLYDEKLMNDLTQTLQQMNELVKVFLEQISTDGLKVDADIF
jgi:phospholipid/cholesterol/gamma-HCH transport system substrate-binding protein